MAHFAEIDENSVVQRVLVVPDEQEHRGQEYLASDLSMAGRWLRCSYNTHGGIHTFDQEKSFRKNYPGPGYTYDIQRDAFIPPSPYPSWLLNEETCLWDPPVPYPDDGQTHTWDEDNQQWILV